VPRVTPPHFVVPLADLDYGPKSVRGALTKEWLTEALSDTDATPREEGEVALVLSLVGKDVLVRGKVQASLQMPCARTLEPVDISVETELHLLLRQAAPDPRAGTHRKHGQKAGEPSDSRGGGRAGHGRGSDSWEQTPELDDSDAALDTFEGEEIVLDSFIREFLVLELPMMPLRSDLREAPEPAIRAPSEPAERLLDPRLAPLAALASRLREENEKE